MTAANERFFCEYCEKYDLPHEMLLKRYSFFFEDRTICDELFSLLMREPKRKLSNLYYYEETLRPKAFFERLRVHSETYGADFEEFCLVAYIALAEKTRALHQKQDVSRKIADRTLASIALWAHKHRALTGKIGLWDYYWCAKYLGGELFRLGELEYQACSNSFGNKYGLSENQILLRIHVPAACDFFARRPLFVLSRRVRFFCAAYRKVDSYVRLRKLAFGERPCVDFGKKQYRVVSRRFFDRRRIRRLRQRLFVANFRRR